MVFEALELFPAGRWWGGDGGRERERDWEVGDDVHFLFHLLSKL